MCGLRLIRVDFFFAGSGRGEEMRRLFRGFLLVLSGPGLGESSWEPPSLGLSAGAVWTSPGSKPESPHACLEAAGSFCLCILPGEPNAELNVWIIQKFLQQ